MIKKEDSGCWMKNSLQRDRDGSRETSYRMVAGVLALS